METQFAINEKEQPQVVQKFESSQAATKVPLSTTTTIVPSQVRDSLSKTSSTYLIRKDIETIKKKYHVEALRNFMIYQSVGSIGK